MSVKILDLDETSLKPLRNSKVRRLTRSTKIYRIMKLEYFIDLFADKKNTLLRPTSWPDKAECNLLRVGFEDVGGHVLGIDNTIYAQCWSLKYDSSLMWDSYTRGNAKDYVRIQTTVGKLYDSLIGFDQNQNALPIEAFISKVDYIHRKKAHKHQQILKEYAKDKFEMYARAALVKANFFQDEAEVRLIIFVQCSDYIADPKNDKFAYSCDPHSLVDLVRLPPNLNAEEIKTIKQKIKTATDYKGSICRSTLLDSWELEPLVLCSLEDLQKRNEDMAKFAEFAGDF